MIDHSDEILSDFLAEAEEYQTLVEDGLTLIQNGSVFLGIESILRPVHTIKGTAGFLGGLDKLARYSHRVEDFLRVVQDGKTLSTVRTTDLLIRSVEGIFDLIDQVRSGRYDLDDSQVAVIVAEIDDTLTAATPADEPVVVQEREGLVIFRVRINRIHLPGQFELITALFEEYRDRPHLVLDLTAVRTIGSTAWGAIWKAGESRMISVIGLSQASKMVFYRWNFDRFINSYETEEEFRKSLTGVGNVRSDA